MIYGRTRVGAAPEDDAMTTHHFYCPDATWPDAAPANYETAETVMTQMWNTIKPYYTSYIKLREFRWYREDDLNPPWGPPARVTAVSLPGTSAGDKNLPPQVAIAVTEYTGLQERQGGRTVRHWGRFYLPAPGATALELDGRLGNNLQPVIANAVDTAYAGMIAAHLEPAVRITGWGGEALPQSGWAPVKEIRVDNLFDTIRRRRYETVTLRETRDTFGSPTDPEN